MFFPYTIFGWSISQKTVQANGYIASSSGMGFM